MERSRAFAHSLIHRFDQMMESSSYILINSRSFHFHLMFWYQRNQRKKQMGGSRSVLVWAGNFVAGLCHWIIMNDEWQIMTKFETHGQKSCINSRFYLKIDFELIRFAYLICFKRAIRNQKTINYYHRAHITRRFSLTISIRNENKLITISLSILQRETESVYQSGI